MLTFQPLNTCGGSNVVVTSYLTVAFVLYNTLQQIATAGALFSMAKDYMEIIINIDWQER